MKILILDTSGKKLIFGLYNDQQQPSIELRASRGKAQIVLPKIDKFLQEKGISAKDIGAILAKKGYGSYTGLRVGLSAANALAWSGDIPIFGFLDNRAQPSNLKIYQDRIRKKIGTFLPKIEKIKKFSKPIFPAYHP